MAYRTFQEELACAIDIAKEAQHYATLGAITGILIELEQYALVEIINKRLEGIKYGNAVRHIDE